MPWRHKREWIYVAALILDQFKQFWALATLLLEKEYLLHTECEDGWAPEVVQTFGEENISSLFGNQTTVPQTSSL